MHGLQHLLNDFSIRTHSYVETSYRVEAIGRNKNFVVLLIKGNQLYNYQLEDGCICI